MKSNFSLLFYIRKQKNYKGGAMPIYIRITVNGRRADLSTGREREPAKWNSKAGRAIGTRQETKSLNNYLDSLQSKVREAHQTLIDTHQPITTENLTNQFTGKTQQSRYLMQLFLEHNAKVKALIGNGFEANTLKGYNTSEKHLTSYLKENYGKSDIEINQLDYAFIAGFEFYLKTTCKISGVSAAKYIKHLKKIVNYCLANGWLKQNPFINYKSTVKAKERTYLTQEELDMIANKKFSIERLSQVRDIFVFSCYTGLSYADVKKLKRFEISNGIDGESWIFTSRQKTDTSSRIPLLPAASAILHRYEDHPECQVKDIVLPVLSNQKMNSYLKEIADLSVIHKHLTFHLARHTFATTVTLSNGVPIESVSKMLGHTNIKTTQHYAKILDLKVSKDMAQLKQKYAVI
ncbi:site-specific recombinase XerD [Mucilaginibacter gracilis]|uniref:Site-specific recombinase XerD n=1 Tax=Mucilaginibacter gracilis TaxID=423350 RepID=A0A495ITR7_9SPHI|nr:site-specific integrase [Mucilaginibacter gracilis]RKR80157.1 site-specific recombinase XerD [Mucilaginibacter gracilis]